MGLAQAIFNSIKQNYFSVWDIISLIEQKSNNNLFDIGLFLGHISIEEHITIYQRDKFYNLHEVDLNYNRNPLGEIIDCLMDIMPFDSDEEQQKGRMKVRSKADMLFFSKQDIYNFKPIMDLGIIEGFNEQIAEPLYKEPTQAYAEFEKINASLELDLAIEKNKVEKLNEEISHLKAHIAELESKKMQYPQKENAINEDKINIANSDLLLIAALMTTLRSEIKVKGKNSQAKVLQRIEDEHGSIKGLSKSRTEKVLASANSLYKALINNQMK